MNQTAFLSSGMVVKHIKVNEKNKKQLQKMLEAQKRDWAAISILALVLTVAVLGLLMSIFTA